MFRTEFAAIAAAACIASAASADTVTMQFTGSPGLHNISLSGGDESHNGPAGHLTHQIDGGDSFNTFCIELAETTSSGNHVYNIVDLAAAPSPGTAHGQPAADRVFEVLAKAVALDWIDINLQKTTDGTSEQMAAIQGAIWAALYGGSADGNATVDIALTALSNESLDSGLFTLMSNRVRAAVNDGTQDQLFVVPLPPAAWAGLGMLGMCAGVRAIRRR